MKTPKTKFLQVLQRAYRLSLLADERQTDDVASLLGEHRLSRRDFIGQSLQAGMVLTVSPTFMKWVGRLEEENQIAIVGAGIAGLNAAYTFKKAGLAVPVYEASKRFGGRMHTAHNLLAENTWTELGGEFVDTNHAEIWRLCEEFGLERLDTLGPAEQGPVKEVFYFNGVKYTEEQLIEEFRPFARQIKKDINSLPDDISYQSPAAAAIDRTSLQQYLQRSGMSGWLYDLIDVAYTGEYGLEIGEQSAINFLWLFDPKTKKGFKMFGESDERYKIKGGNHSLPAKLEEQVRDQIRYEHTLEAISKKGDQYVLNFSNGKEVRANYVILTVPFTILRQIDWQVELPEVKRRSIDELGYGANSKLFMGFDRRVWREQNYLGFMYSEKVHTGWDNTQMQAGNQGGGGFTVFLGGKAGKDLDVSQYASYLGHLNEVYPGMADTFNQEKSVFNWGNFKYSQGSYACYKPGQITSIGGAEFMPVGNLYFAGEHTSVDFQGFMNGAAETGRMAAEKILAKVKA